MTNEASPQAVSLLPVGEPCSLRDCPPGPFLFGGHTGFKTEYCTMVPVGPVDVPGPEVRWVVGTRPDAYVLDSGEYFWGGALDHAAREMLVVQPLASRALSRPSPATDGVVWGHAVKFGANGWAFAEDEDPDALDALRADPEYQVVALYAAPPAPAEGRLESFGWVKRMNETHPIGLAQPSDWRFSPHPPLLAEGSKSEWFDTFEVVARRSALTAPPAADVDSTALNTICDPGIVTGLRTPE